MTSNWHRPRRASIARRGPRMSRDIEGEQELARSGPATRCPCDCGSWFHGRQPIVKSGFDPDLGHRPAALPRRLQSRRGRCQG